MRLALMITLASLLSTQAAPGGVLLYKLTVVERFVGAGMDKHGAIRGTAILDLNTSNLTIVATSLINRRKDMAVDSIPSVDIQKLTVGLARTQTVISTVEKDRPPSGANTFAFTYARGLDSLVEWAPGQTAMWPRRLNFKGTTLNVMQGLPRAEESVGTMTLLAKNTIQANALALSREQLITQLVSQWQQAGYALVSGPTNLYDALAEYSNTQGGTSGTWFYQEYDGSIFGDFIFRQAGNISSGFQPTWAATNTDLPLLFKDPAVTDALVVAPGVPSVGLQPSRHDVALNWVAPTSGLYSITGFVRGDNRIGSGGNGFQFGIYRGQDSLYTLDIKFDDKTDHDVSLPYIYIGNGERIGFRVFDKGNNEYDYGAFNFSVLERDTRFLGFAPR